jgi:hypothetical protein
MTSEDLNRKSANFNLDSQLALEGGTVDKAFLAKFSDAARQACL